MTGNETENFEAFDLVARALEELELHEAAVKARGDKDEHPPSMARDKQGPPHESPLGNAVRYLNQALVSPEANLDADKETSKKDNKAGGDQDYFKAHYLLAMTEYFRGNAYGAGNLFEHIVDPTQTPKIAARTAAENARAQADSDFFNEIHYNLGAAYFEQEQFDKAISEFDSVIESTEKRDLLLELLARSAKALAHSYKGESAEAGVQMGKIKRAMLKDAIFLFRFGWRDGIVITKRKLDERTVHAIKEIRRQVERRLAGSLPTRPGRVQGAG